MMRIMLRNDIKALGCFRTYLQDIMDKHGTFVERKK